MKEWDLCVYEFRITLSIKFNSVKKKIKNEKRFLALKYGVDVTFCV